MGLRIFAIAGAAILALSALPGTASATSWFDTRVPCQLTPSNTQGACGFAGKGDVQLAFSWNNAQVQANAGGITFTYNATATYDVTIEFDTGNPTKTVSHHTIAHNTSEAVTDTVLFTDRTKKQISGFLLNSIGSITTSGDPVPSVGDSCPNGNLGTCFVTAVTPLTSTGALSVNFGTSSVPLPNTTLLP